MTKPLLLMGQLRRSVNSVNNEDHHHNEEAKEADDRWSQLKRGGKSVQQEEEELEKGKQPEDAQPPQHQQHHQQQQQQSCSPPPPCIVTLASPKRSRCHRRESLKDDHHNNICLLPVVRHPSSSICCPSSPAGCSSSTPPARSSTRDSSSDSTDSSASSRRTSSSSSSSTQSCDCHKRHRQRCLKRQRQRSYRRCPEKAYCRLLKENTTFHGIRDSIQTAGWLRALWVCIIVLASVAALIGCGLIVWEFNTRPLSVTYSIRENVSLVLPDIVICPFNRFNRTFLQSANVSDQLAQYLELAFPQASQHPFQYKSYKELLDHIDELEAELVQLLDTLGISFAEFIKQSAIDCRAFFVNKAICDTVQELMTMAGKCFRIPGEEQRNDGHGHAQRIIVRLPTQLYNPAPNQMMNHGIVVKLAERGKGIDHDMSFVPAGVHAIFPLTATRFEFKHYPPHFLCREEEDTTYSRVWCFEECFLDKAERECNCSLAAAAQPGTSNICTPRQFFNCVYTVLRFDDANVVDEQVAQCKSRCLPPCKNWRYEKTVTYAHFPSETARHFVKVPAKWEELQNTIILEVFYTTLDYTVIQQMLTITPSSFVAQLGGQISLWIGGSIISVMQLFIYVFSYFCVYFRRTNGQRRRRSAAKAIDNNSGPTAAAADDDADDNEGRKRRRKRREERKSRKSSRVEDGKDNREEQWHTLNGLRLHQDGTMKRNNNNVACITVRV